MAGKESKTADEPSFPENRIFPPSNGFSRRAFSYFKEKGNRYQKQNGQKASEELKGKRANQIHAHTLGNKSGAPDQGCHKQEDTALNSFFHNHHRRLLYHNLP